MSRVRRPDPTDLAVPLLAAAASFFTVVSWAGLSEVPSSFLVPLYWVALGVAALGIGLRALPLAAPLVPVLQLLAVGLVLHREWTSGGLLGGWVPTLDSLAVLRQVLELSVETTSRHAAPVPADEPMFAPIMVVVGAAVVLCVDALAATFRRGPIAGLPLLAAFTVPVSLLDGVSWLTFALTAGCFVLMLAAEQAASLGRWGRRVGTDHGTDAWAAGSAPRPVRLSSLWPAAGRIGAVGVAAAVLAPVVVPAGDGWFGGGGGPGIGGGGDRVSLDNPFVDIRRDLVDQREVPLVYAETDDPNPSYLRLTVLDEFDGDTWRPSERHIPPENRAAGELPLPTGLTSETPRQAYEWQLRVLQRFDTTWLPTPYPASSIGVAGDWRYDVDTLDLVSADGETAAGLGYSTVGLDLEPDATQLASAGAGGRVLVFANTDLPESVPDWVEELADTVTEGGESNYEKAMLLQRWFRSDGGFTYSTDPAPGNGLDDLESFLGDGPGGRVGYCEQFAASMALMARTLGIPARVAVGFLGGVRDEDRWVYRSKDMHAWPELYFEGAGWVRFEPTPSARTGDPPGYTVEELTDPEETAAPSVAPTTAQPTQADRRQEGAVEGASGTEGSWFSGWLAVLVVVALVGVLLLAPRLLRDLARRRRYAGTTVDAVVEGAWAEVRATALDLGRGWDDGETLRHRQRALTPWLGRDEAGLDAASALNRLVRLLERSRYSRAGLHGELADSAEVLSRTVAAALHRTARPRAQRRATWLPSSLWKGRPQQGRVKGPETTAPVDGEKVSL